VIRFEQRAVGSSVLGKYLITLCGLAWAYLRERMRAWRSRPPRAKPAKSGAA
jgi:hypothetical protein